MVAKVVKLIYTDEDLRGDGTERNILRRVPKLYTLEGELVCSYDCGPTSTTDTYWVNPSALTQLGN